MAFYRCDRGLGFDTSNSTGNSSDVLYLNSIEQLIFTKYYNTSTNVQTGAIKEVRLGSSDLSLTQPAYISEAKFLRNDIILTKQNDFINKNISKEISIYGVTGSRNLYHPSAHFSFIHKNFFRYNSSGWSVSLPNTAYLYLYQISERELVKYDSNINIVKRLKFPLIIYNLHKLMPYLYGRYTQKYLDNPRLIISDNDSATDDDVKAYIRSRYSVSTKFDYNIYSVIWNPITDVNLSISYKIHYQLSEEYAVIEISGLYLEYLIDRIIFNDGTTCYSRYRSIKQPTILTYALIQICDSEIKIINVSNKYYRYNRYKNSVQNCYPNVYSSLNNIILNQDNKFYNININADPISEISLNYIKFLKVYNDKLYIMPSTLIINEYNINSLELISTYNVSFDYDPIYISNSYISDIYDLFIDDYIYTIFASCYVNYKRADHDLYTYVYLYNRNYIVISNRSERFSSTRLPNNINTLNNYAVSGISRIGNNIYIQYRNDILKIIYCNHKQFQLSVVLAQTYNRDYLIYIINNCISLIFLTGVYRLDLPLTSIYLLNDYDTSYSGYSIDTSNESYTDYYFN